MTHQPTEGGSTRLDWKSNWNRFGRHTRASTTGNPLLARADISSTFRPLFPHAFTFRAYLRDMHSLLF